MGEADILKQVDNSAKEKKPLSSLRISMIAALSNLLPLFLQLFVYFFDFSKIPDVLLLLVFGLGFVLGIIAVISGVKTLVSRRPKSEREKVLAISMILISIIEMILLWLLLRSFAINAARSAWDCVPIKL